MKYKSIISLCCIAVLLALTGCQLAQENAGTSLYGNKPGEDKLAGIFVTTEYPDLFDNDAYSDDNIKITSGGELVPDGNTQEYQGRLYAALTMITSTDEKTGETFEQPGYVFDGISGISFFSTIVSKYEGSEGFRTSTIDTAIIGASPVYNFKDNSCEIIMEGTLYVSPANKECIYYVNPVYQSADGSVFLTTGNGFTREDASDEVTVSEGEIMSFSMESTTTTTENSRTITESMSVGLSIEVMFAPEKIVILQMDADYTLLSRIEYKPDRLSESIVMESGATCLIVETHKRNASNDIVITRDIYDKEVKSIESFLVGTDGIYEKKYTQIKWKS